MSKAFRTKYLFQKYLINSCTAAEMEELFELLNDQNNLDQVESNLQELWDKTSTSADPAESELYLKFKHKIGEQKTAYLYPAKKFSYTKWAVAACLSITMGFIAYLSYAPIQQYFSPDITTARINPAARRIILSDGSVVILNKGSHLNYPEKFGSEIREVHLNGEAYFDIKHDQKRPFLVHTGKLVTKVLGTAFNVKTGADENLIEVTVSRGKVAVSDPKKTLAVLLPNEKISYDSKASAFRKEHTDATVTTLWKEEDLVLDNISLEEAVRKIEERYHASIIMENEQIKNCKFTAYFLNTTSLDQIIQVISKINHLNYNHNQKGVYTLSGNGCE